MENLTLYFKMFIMSFVASCVHLCGHKNSINLDASGRIVGGHPAEPGEYPWQVSLQSKELFGLQSHFCGGSIIHPSWVVTAGHCVENIIWSSQPVVAAGKNTLSKREPHEQYANISHIIQHENYNRETAVNDIALIKLEKPLIMSHFINTICLPESVQQTEGLVTVTGWGSTSEGGLDSDVLQVVDLRIISNKVCNSEYNRTGDKIYDGMLCAGFEDGGKDACQGDSGGPLIAIQNDTASTYYLAGIVSWGFGCAHPHYGGVYTRVAYYREWIRAHTGV